jgi:hypothetical protein
VRDGDVTGETFHSPEEAVAALMVAVEKKDAAGLQRIFGPDSEDLINSGDEVADAETRRHFLERYTQKHSIEKEAADVAVLHVGDLDWPFPLPIVETEHGWVFDTESGKEEVIDRRIGHNELSAIEVCRAYVDAQRQYALVDWDGDGILEYAQKLRSTPGKRDGLFWEPAPGESESPLGPLFARAEGEGYTLRPPGAEVRPYHGYFYRVLRAQGPHASGGAFEYMVRDSMMGGFALIAYPANYGVSGIKTFIVSHAGLVYEKDLGDETEKVASEMTLYDPDDSWAPSPQ